MSLNEFRQHLNSRGLMPDTEAWVDDESQLVYFPLWSVTGVLVGYQRYDWRAEKVRSNKGRYFTWITEAYKPCAAYGLRHLSLVNRAARRNVGNSQRIILVTEGIWDTLRAEQAGYPSIAVLTATPSKQFVQWFKMITYGVRTVAILDNDANSAGLGLTKLCTSSILCELHKDLGEHTPLEAKEFLDESTHSRFSH